MPIYGVQYHRDYEELGLCCVQDTFETRDDKLARRSFARRVAKLRRTAKQADTPAIKGDIQLFRLNSAKTDGVLLRAVPTASWSASSPACTQKIVPLVEEAKKVVQLPAQERATTDPCPSCDAEFPDFDGTECKCGYRRRRPRTKK